MLHFVRRNAQSGVIVFVVGMVVVVMALFGVSSLTAGPSVGAALVTVNERSVQPLELQRAELNLVESYRSIYKENFTPQVKASLNLRQQAIDGLIDRLVLLDRAEEMGLVISDQELKDDLTSTPYFLIDGRFSKDRYMRALRGARQTPADYEEGRRQDLAIQRLQGLIQDGVGVADEEVRQDILSREEKVVLSFVKIRSSDFTEAVEVTDEDLQKFYDANIHRYQNPERVRGEVLAYPPSEFSAGFEPTDDAIQEYYDANKASRFTEQHQVRARHILKRVAADASDSEKTEVREEMEEILAKLEAGEDFEAIAKEESQDPGSAVKGGDLGFFGKGQMVPPFEEAAFGLGAGETSGIVETSFGLHIIKTEEIREEQVKDLDAVRDEIVTALTEERAKERAGEAAVADADALATGSTLASLAEARGLEVTTPEALKRHQPVPGVLRSGAVTNALFDLEPGQHTDPIDASGTWVIAVLSEKIPAAAMPFEEARDRVESQFRLDTASERAKERGEELLADARSRGSLADALAAVVPAASEPAEEDGPDAEADADGDAEGAEAVAQAPTGPDWKLEETGEFGRQGMYIPKIGSSPLLRAAIPRLTDEKPIAEEVFIVAGDAYLVALKDRILPDDDAVEDQLDSTRESLLGRRRQEVFQEYLDGLKLHAQIAVDDELLAQIPAI